MFSSLHKAKATKNQKIMTANTLSPCIENKKMSWKQMLQGSLWAGFSSRAQTFSVELRSGLLHNHLSWGLEELFNKTGPYAKETASRDTNISSRLMKLLLELHFIYTAFQRKNKGGGNHTQGGCNNNEMSGHDFDAHCPLFHDFAYPRHI